MTTTPTQLAVPSENPQDLKFNAGKIDEFVTSLALKYIDRLGGEHFTIEGIKQLAFDAMSSFGYVTISSFEDGAVITTPNQALLWESNGEYYKWTGDLPKTVLADSTPDSTGGIGPGAWLSIGDALLRTMLASSTGSYQVGHGSSTVGAELDTLNHYTVSVNVKDFGAVGNWNETTQTGTDDTVAFQNAINDLAAMPNIYMGGVRQLFVPNGNYRIKNLTIPDSFSFGLEIKGAGCFNTRLYMKPDINTVPCILCNVEYVIIDSIEILGSLKRNSASSDRSIAILEVKLPDGRPDCDVKIMPTVSMGSATTICKIHGRGFHCNGASLFFAGTALEIVCDSTSWGAGANAQETGMRNYLLKNCRFDTVNIGVKITGAGNEKDYISDLSFSGNDIFSMDRLLLATDATIQHSIFDSNTSISSFAYGVFEVKRVVNISITNNKWLNFYNRSLSPSSDNQYMHGMVLCSGAAERLLISGNTMSYNTLHIVQIGSNSNSITIIGNIFENSYLGGSTALMIRGANCEYLSIINNTFWNSTTPSVAVSPWGTTQTSPTAIFENNHSSFPITNNYISYTPTLKYGNAAVVTSAQRARYRLVNRMVTISMQISSADSTSGSASDEVNISVPLNPASDSVVTSSFSGSGVINWQSGAVAQAYRATVITGAGIVIVKADGSTLKRGDITGSYSFSLDVTYKI